MEQVGDYEFNKASLIGHGAFAMVFKGRHKVVTNLSCIFAFKLTVAQFIANVHVHVRYMSSSVRPSVCLSVCPL